MNEVPHYGHPVFTIVGPPNAGKSALLGLLRQDYEVETLSTGDLCRRHKATNTEAWREARRHMNSTGSTLWPTELLVATLKDDLLLAMRRGAVVLDGFLRKPDQINSYLEITQSHHVSARLIIQMSVSDTACIARSRERNREDDDDIHRRLEEWHRDGIPALHQLLGMGHVSTPIEYLAYNAELPENEGGNEYRQRFVSGLGNIFGLRNKVLAAS